MLLAAPCRHQPRSKGVEKPQTVLAVFSSHHSKVVLLLLYSLERDKPKGVSCSPFLWPAALQSPPPQVQTSGSPCSTLVSSKKKWQKCCSFQWRDYSRKWHKQPVATCCPLMCYSSSRVCCHPSPLPDHPAAAPIEGARSCRSQGATFAIKQSLGRVHTGCHHLGFGRYVSPLMYGNLGQLTPPGPLWLPVAGRAP